MLLLLSRFICLGTLATILIGPVAGAADPEQSHSFKFRIQSQLEMTIPGEKQSIETDTVLNYTWKSQGAARILSFDSVHVKAEQNGKLIMNNSLSRAKFVSTTTDGKSEEVPRETAPAELKAKLQDSFGVPLCKLEVDKNGKETNRKVVAGPGAKDFLAQGLISNALLFHPPYMSATDMWSAPTKMSMGNGGFVEGKLNYTKAAAGKNGQAVKVSGTLTNKSFRPPGSPVTVKNAKYLVKGEQTYDPAQREWVSGKLVFDVSFDLNAGKNPFGTAEGVLVVTLDPVKSEK